MSFKKNRSRGVKNVEFFHSDPLLSCQSNTALSDGCVLRQSGGSFAKENLELKMADLFFSSATIISTLNIETTARVKVAAKKDDYLVQNVQG